jgi:hypothetical protein
LIKVEEIKIPKEIIEKHANDDRSSSRFEQGYNNSNRSYQRDNDDNYNRRPQNFSNNNRGFNGDGRFNNYNRDDRQEVRPRFVRDRSMQDDYNPARFNNNKRQVSRRMDDDEEDNDDYASRSNRRRDDYGDDSPRRF